VTSPRTVSLRGCNTLRLRATSLDLQEPGDRGALGRVLEAADRRAVGVLPLGEGSNVVLVGDLPLVALRYRERGCRELSRDAGSVVLRVAAGEPWHAFTVWALAQGFYGLENLALIPGTVGAAPIQNIGAYGVELAEFVEAVHAVAIDSGEPLTFTRADCDFAYRDSVFKRAWRDRCVIVAVDLRLRLQDAPNLSYAALREWLKSDGAAPSAASVHRAVVALRRERLPDPAFTPNAGSFFKNPIVPVEHARDLQTQWPALPVFELYGSRVKLAAGWLIEACGWKGYSEGGVGVHPGHALVLVNLGADSGAALLALARRIQASVEERFGCRLEIEPRVYGDVA
jgi:UDP-N-acetylmuramate dehydrogenase